MDDAPPPGGLNCGLAQRTETVTLGDMGKALRFAIPVLVVITACGNGSDPEATRAEEDTMDLASVFEDQQPIPEVYSCDGDDISPPLSISGLPETTNTLAVIVDDPDAPSGTFDHWVAFDIPLTDEIPEGVSDLGTAGVNSSGNLGYTGPCPPSGTHRYFFRLYALDTTLGLSEGATKQEVLEAAEGHVLAQGTLMGTYQR